MDKRTIQGYVLIFLIFIGFAVFQNNTYKEAEKIEKQGEEQVKSDSSSSDTSSNKAPIIRVAGDTGVKTTDTIVIDGQTFVAEVEEPAAEPEVVVPEVWTTIENEELKINLTSKGGRIGNVELKNYQKYDSSALNLLDSNFTFNYTFNTNDGIVSTSKVDFVSSEATATGVTYTYTFKGGGTMVQKYELKEGFVLDYTVNLNGMDKVIPSREREFMLDFSAKLSQLEKGLKGERQESTIFYKYGNDSDIDRLSKTSSDEEEMAPNLQWVSFKQKFFNSTFVFTGNNQETNNMLSIEVPENDDADYVKTMSADLNMAYNGTDRDGFRMQMYFGPNHYQTLKGFDKQLDGNVEANLEKILPLGWGPISWINMWIIIPIFNWLNNSIASFGLIILLLTLMIKGALIFPMYKIYKSSAKMKLLKPELDELKAKHGNNMQKMQQEQMKLYKKAGVSPFGGCLPQLVQFPFLIAMFRFFPASIELRQKSFLWATDLSTYDSILDLPFSIPFYGDHISLFTLLMAGSTFLYTLTNSNMNAGINNQMKFIMYLMPVMLLFWFNSYASGLSYYYFLANMITFGQNYIFRKFIVDEEKLHRQMQANKKKKGPVKKSRFQKKLEEMAKKQGLDPNTMKPKGR